MTTLDPTLLIPEGKIDTRTKEGKRYKQALATKACELKEEGWPITAIAEALKVSPPTVSAYVSFSEYGGGGRLGLSAQRPVYRATDDAAPRLAELRREAQEKREREREGNIAWASAAYRNGERPWHADGTYDQLPLGPDEQRAVEALVDEQARESRRAEESRGERPKGSQSVFSPWNLDAPLLFSAGDPGEPRTTYSVEASEALDPLTILTEATEHRLQEVLGDVDFEDVACMGENELGLLRERIRDAGLAPSSVQRSERERLAEPIPHRGAGGQMPKRVAKASRHRGRNEASDLHKSRGKRFKRHTDERRERQKARGRKTAAHTTDLERAA